MGVRRDLNATTRGIHALLLEYFMPDWITNSIEGEPNRIRTL